MNKIRALIVDDELNGIENLVHILDEFCPNVNVVGTARNLEDAERNLNLLNPNLVFLDVQIGTRTIFELLENLDTTPFEIIFLSAYDHAVKAFKFMAIDYLLKPIDINELRQAIKKAEHNMKNRNFYDHANELLCAIKSSNIENQKIAIPTSDGYEFLHVAKILYCIADGSYTKIHLRSGKQLIASQPLRHYEELISNLNFYRIHNSSLVNTKYIKKVSRSDGGYLIMDDGKELSIARSKKEGLFKILKL
ncbi:MAG: LytTR family DNA-binding domain-containing protein [Bacteroidota bacterium]